MFTKAQRHLARRDAVLKRLIAHVGPCTLRPDPDGFGVLARSIVSQQISTKAALSIAARLLEVLGKAGLSPKALLAASDEALRSAGLSANKVRSLRDLAEKVHGGAVPLDDLPERSDEEVIATLLPVRGIGRWTAEMFLIFSLGRFDVLPVGDYGLRAGVQRAYKLEETPGKDELTKLAEPWQPYRSIGTWFIWKSAGPVPQSDPDA
jgi:DNA-3-methyladenine glycosylase II